MKRQTNVILSILALLLLFNETGFAQDLYSTITNIWWNGPKTNIFTVANERLSSDTNDIVGIVLRMEGEWTFGNASSISNATHRYLSVGATIRTPAFRLRFPLEALNFSLLLESMPQMSNDDWARERESVAELHREMLLEKSWSALNDDGWLGPIQPENVLNRQELENHTPRQWRGEDTVLGKMLVAYMVYCATKTSGNPNSEWESLLGQSDAQLLSDAQRRLAEAPGDLFGATLSLLYHYKRCDPIAHSNATERIAILSNEVERVIQIGSTETRFPFSEQWPWMSAYLENVQIWLSCTNAPSFEAALHYDDLHPTP